MTLNTIMKHVAKAVNRLSYLILSITALKTLVNSDIPTKQSNKWITYHYIPTKLPIIAATTKTNIAKNPD